MFNLYIYLFILYPVGPSFAWRWWSLSVNSDAGAGATANIIVAGF